MGMFFKHSDEFANNPWCLTNTEEIEKEIICKEKVKERYSRKYLRKESNEWITLFDSTKNNEMTEQEKYRADIDKLKNREAKSLIGKTIMEDKLGVWDDCPPCEILFFTDGTFSIFFNIDPDDNFYEKDKVYPALLYYLEYKRKKGFEEFYNEE